MDTTEPYVARACSWAALLAAFILSWTTWVGVGDIAEYGAFRYALPVCVDGYIVTVLMAWIAPRDDRAARFARWNVYLSAGLSILTQSVYHGANVYSHTTTPWKAVIAWLAGALPPLFAALSVHFRTGVRLTTGTPGSPPTAQPGAILPQPATTSPAPVPASSALAPAFSSPPSVEKSPSSAARPVPVVPSPVLPARGESVPTSPRRPLPRSIARSQAYKNRKLAYVSRIDSPERKREAARYFETDPGMSNQLIATRLGVTDQTIRKYRREWAAAQSAPAVSTSTNGRVPV